jgi:hypothetical protein
VRRTWTTQAWITVLAAGTIMLAGCSASSPARVASCGSTHTAAGVPVSVEVVKGSVGCSTALSVENKYSALIKAGDVRGNGGGAPVSVNGWTCQGYLTPQILATGDASQCHTGTTEIVAVLLVPSSAPTPASTTT